MCFDVLWFALKQKSLLKYYLNSNLPSVLCNRAIIAFLNKAWRSLASSKERVDELCFHSFWWEITTTEINDGTYSNSIGICNKRVQIYRVLPIPVILPIFANNATPGSSHTLIALCLDQDNTKRSGNVQRTKNICVWRTTHLCVSTP